METPKIEGLREELREARKELAALRQDVRLKADIKAAKALLRTAEKDAGAANAAVDRAERDAMKRMGILKHGRGSDTRLTPYSETFINSVEYYLGITMAEDEVMVRRACNRLADKLVEADPDVRAANRAQDAADRVENKAYDRLDSFEGQLFDAERNVNATAKDLERAIRAQQAAVHRRKPKVLEGRLRAARLKTEDLERGVTDPRTIWKVA